MNPFLRRTGQKTGKKDKPTKITIFIIERVIEDYYEIIKDEQF